MAERSRARGLWETLRVGVPFPPTIERGRRAKRECVVHVRVTAEEMAALQERARGRPYPWGPGVSRYVRAVLFGQR